MFGHAKSLRAILALVLLDLVGCAGMQIRYKPVEGSAQPIGARVTLKVVDARTGQHASGRPNQVGLRRTAMGIPYHLVDEHEGVVLRTIGDASTDALRQAGVVIEAGAPHVHCG